MSVLLNLTFQLPYSFPLLYRLYLLTEGVTGLSVTLELNSAPSFPSDGTDVTVLGIGMQDQAGGGIADGTFLYDVVIPVVNIQDCDAAWGDSLNPDIMLCAGKIFMWRVPGFFWIILYNILTSGTFL